MDVKLFLLAAVLIAAVSYVSAGTWCSYKCPKIIGYRTSCGGWNRQRICTRYRTSFGICYKLCSRRVDGGFSAWTPFKPITSCSKSCGKGFLRTMKTRQCNNPTPKYGGRKCYGWTKMYGVKLCNLKPCPINGKWSKYGRWAPVDECPVLCGGGKTKMVRSRKCNNPAPKYGGKICSGPRKQFANPGECNTKPCGDLCPEGKDTYYPHKTRSTDYYKCEDQVARMKTCHENLEWNQPASQCVAIPCDIQELGHFQPHPTDSSKFRYCLINRQFITLSCPTGLKFIESKGACE